MVPLRCQTSLLFCTLMYQIVSSSYVLTKCHGSDATCYVDESLLSAGDWHEIDALGTFFLGCNGYYWQTKRNWCFGKAIPGSRLRATDDDQYINGFFNDQCVEDLITDPCTGEIVQYPTDYTDVITDGDYSIYSWQNLACSTNSIINNVQEVDFTTDYNVSCDLNAVGGNLSSLQDLDTFRIVGNRITGDVPEFLADAGVSYISLELNSLDGTIPDIFTKLGNDLIFFEVNDNYLTGTVPSTISLCDSLSIISLEDNYLTGSLPDVSSFSGLTQFTAQNNRFTGPLFSMQGMSSLNQLRVQNNFLTGPVPDITSLSGPVNTLRRLLMQNNILTGAFPSNMEDFTTLQFFRADNNNVTSLVPKLTSTITQFVIAGPGNTWLCPFPDAANSVITAGINSVNCTCPAGSSCNEGAQCRYSCATCPGGRFSNTTNQPFCYDCATGHASSTNTTVGARYYDVTGGTLSCGSCSVGRYNNQTGQVNCESCHAGRYTPFNGTLKCLRCGVGTYSEFDGATSCASCDPGSVTNQLASKQCNNCPYGKATGLSTTVCSDCSKGKYGPSRGLVNCTDCSAGTFANYTGMENCTDCRAGRYSDVIGLDKDCELCSPGSYSDTPASTSCTNCDPFAGLAQNRSGQTRCHYCPDGTYAGDGTNCTECPLGRAGRGSTSIRNSVIIAGVSKTVFQCTGCSQGTFADHVGMGMRDCSCTEGCNAPFSDSLCDTDGCTFCAVGYVAVGDPSPAYAAGYSSCTICSAGKFWESNIEPCQNCSSGRYQPDEGEQVCDLCPEGQYQPGEGSSACVSCTPGYAQSAQGQDNCPACEPGTFTNESTSSSCSDCLAGHYQPNEASVTCLACAPGYAQPRSANTTCPACGPGSFSNQSAAANCTTCPDGFYQPFSAKTHCIMVTAGYYRVSTSEVAACPAGKYSEAKANSFSECKTCYAGSFSENASSFCTNCTAGTFAELPGSARCENCPRGTYSSSGAYTCTACLPGEYAENAATTEEDGCTQCSSGTFSSEFAAISASNCTECGPGTASPAGAANCSLCPVGTYTAVFGTPFGFCTRCSAGTYLPTKGGTSSSNCTLCKTGSYSDNGAAFCTLCATGTYTPVTGTEFGGCLDCPAGTQLDQEGGSSLTNCTDCLPGSFSDQGADLCTLCYVGTFTPNSGTAIGGCTNCSAGKYLDEEGGISVSNCTNCKAGSYSSAGSGLCSLCERGTYSSTPATVKGDCQSCPAGTALNILGGISIQNCTNCTAGKSSYEGSATCDSCPIGKHSLYPGTASPCSDCHRGRYAASIETAMPCSSAPRGSYVSSFGASSFELCGAGTYSNRTESWNCSLCPAGSFVDTTGAQQCISCPNGTSSALNNRTSCDICAAGKYSHFKSTSGLCLSCPVDTYQPDPQADRCLPCSALDEGDSAFSTNGLTGATSCIDGSSSSCNTVTCKAWFQIGAASTSIFVIILVCFLVFGRGYLLAKNSFDAKFEDYIDDNELMYGSGRAGRYEVTCKRLDVYEGPHLSERKVHQKLNGDVLNVVASKDDWLLLDDGEGWVLGFDKKLGARVSLMDEEYNIRMSVSGKKRPSKGTFRSSIYGGSVRRQSQVNKSVKEVNNDDDGWENSGAPAVASAKQDHRRSSVKARRHSITENGKKLARRASSIIAHPLKAIGDIVEASVQNSVIGAANSRAKQAYYEVDVEEDEEASRELAKIEEDRKKAEAFAFMEHEDDESLVRSVIKALPSMSHIFVHPAGEKVNGKYPPPPSENDPYDLIETKKYHGSEGGAEGALPPPPPKDLPPSKVPISLFEDSSKCTYEVQYYKVHIRAGPSLRAPILGELNQKDIVYVEDENRHWVKVKAGEPHGIAGSEKKGHPAGWVLRFQKKYGPLLRLVDAEVWDTYFEPSTGRPYYVNRATKESTWKHPSKRGRTPKPPSLAYPNQDEQPRQSNI